jgi:DNA polymerase I-like protein with 3'-5' exonuclease and polymerase domains
MKIANDGRPDHTHQLAFIHDELQFETTPDRAEFLKHYLERCAESAGEYYNLRIRIDAEGKVGDNWAEVH